MTKISGFFLSALLVVLCFWLNVFSFPNVVQSGTSPVLNEAVSVVKETAVPNAVAVPNAEATNEQTAESGDEQSAETNEPSSDASDQVDPNAEQESSSNVGASVAETTGSDLANADAASNRQYAENSADRVNKPRLVGVSQRVKNEEAVLKPSSRAQGGKYVSIPSVGTDAFQSLPPAYADRVFGIAFAAATQDSNKDAEKN